MNNLVNKKSSRINFFNVLFGILFLLFIIPLITFGQTSIDKNLKYGDKGQEVVELKKFLIKEGVYKKFLGFIDIRPKYFGKKVQKALKEWQKLKNLPETGEFNSETKEFTNKVLTGDKTLLAQEKEIEKLKEITTEVKQEIPEQKDLFKLISNAETVKGERYVDGNAKLFIVTLDEGPTRKIEVLSDKLINLEIQLEQSGLVSIELNGAVKSTTTLTIRGLIPNSTYYQYVDGLTKMTQLKTNSEGILTISINQSVQKGIGLSPTPILGH
ncbi:MAG: peptidoglycan-binding domain-containing protein [Candidatus Paceibacterota bacterium]|jgi:hypothetical protein